MIWFLTLFNLAWLSILTYFYVRTTVNTWALAKEAADSAARARAAATSLVQAMLSLLDLLGLKPKPVQKTDPLFVQDPPKERS